MSDPTKTTTEMEPITLVEIGMSLLEEGAKKLRDQGDDMHEKARDIEDIVARWKLAKGTP